MPLAYYSAAAEQDFWAEHWGGHSVEALLAVARRSPLTALITGALPPGARVLEAGCGLGQYVVLLRERGWPAVGVDQVTDALARCRRVAPVPLAASDLADLAVRDGALDAYVSLGVVEHDPAGPDAILAEARRVLRPGGVLVVSVPYLNGLRRAGAPWLRRRARAVAARGGRFYQYAFSRAELRAALARHGFAARSMHPYDPARVLRRLLPRGWRPDPARSGGSGARLEAGCLVGVDGRPGDDAAREAAGGTGRGDVARGGLVEPRRGEPRAPGHGAGPGHGEQRAGHGHLAHRDAGLAARETVEPRGGGNPGAPGSLARDRAPGGARDAGRGHRAVAAAPDGGAPPGDASGERARGGPRAVAGAAARRVLYSPPALRLLGHMLLAVAVKA
jgi:SAM-dependent methyltransferase